MTPEEVRVLAQRIAELLSRRDWVPGPVRPPPPGGPTSASLPSWAGAAQSLPDVAPSRRPGAPQPGPRPAYHDLTAAARAAAAGRGPSPLPSPTVRAGSGTSTTARSVPVAVSNRHIHLSQQDVERLFGAGHHLTPDRPITQPGQFAARERVRVVAPDAGVAGAGGAEGAGEAGGERGGIDGVRVVGPARATTQVELAASDFRRLGLKGPVMHSGRTAGAAPIRLEGPAGAVDIEAGAMIAARHLHVAPEDADRFGLSDGDRVTLVVGGGDRQATLQNVLVRAGERHATELHLDVDEARAFAVDGDARAEIVGRPFRRRSGRGTAGTAGAGGAGGAEGAGGTGSAASGRRVLVTERDVDQYARDGQTLTDGGHLLVTPAARDRAKALGIWSDAR